MFKKLLIPILALVVIALAAGYYNSQAASTQDVALPQLPPPQVSQHEPESLILQPELVVGSDQALLENAVVVQTYPADLSESEAAGLLFMREEEKLARDVYLVMYAKWSVPVFQNISQSEQSHMDSIKGLLDRYNLEDPASAQTGVFTNPDLQVLYNTLVAQGSQALADAYKVGAAIEEIDILDLQDRIARADQADIQRVYNNLLDGSKNHLRAFVSVLAKQTGQVYQPQYMTQQAYDEIVTGTGRSSNYGQGGFGGSQGGRGQGVPRGRAAGG